LSLLFIFGLVIQVWADPSGIRNGNDSREKLSGDKEFGVKSLVENLKANNKLNLIESIDRLFSLDKIDEGTWRYKPFDLQGAKEIRPLDSNFSPSVLNLYPDSNRYVEEEGPQGLFELLQSKLKRTEIFVLFHLLFNPKENQMFLEMDLTSFSDIGVNFFIPISED
jgi:hypothetical protein